MQPVMKAILKNIILGALLAVALLGAMALFLSIPDILAWVAGYIGGLMTYTLYFGGLCLLVGYCINRAK